MELLKLLSTSQIFAQIVSFLVLLAIMRIFVWKKFLKLLDDRKEHVASELVKADAARAAVQTMKAEYEAKVESMDAVARARIEEAVAEGERIAAEIIDKARLEAEKASMESREMLNSEIKKAREDIKKEIVDIAIGAAEKVIEEKITDKEDRRIAEDFVNRAGALK